MFRCAQHDGRWGSDEMSYEAVSFTSKIENR